MNLIELKAAVEDAIEYAKECGENPSEITVKMQIDRENGDSIWTADEIELHYDNNVCVDGCVIYASLEANSTNHRTN